ncbi:MAG: replicative DNA helicase [Bacteroidales bacterium]|jgi:replicative DNA helicase
MTKQEQENNSGSKKRMQKKSTATQQILEHGKLQPQAVDLEEAVLGAMMLEKDALTSVIDKLRPECFYNDNHKKIYQSILRLFSRSEPVDILTVTNELKQIGELEAVGGPYYVTQLTNRVASSANIEYHAGVIIEKYIQRELISISGNIINKAYEDTTDVFDLLNEAEKNLFAVSEINLRRTHEDISLLINKAIEEMQNAGTKGNNLSGIPSGFVDLDRVTAGWQRSDLIIVASRPGMGKTAFSLTMARNMAIEHNIPVAVFSLEMSATQLVMRLISSEAEISSDKLRRGDLQQYEWEQLHSKIKQLADAPIFIDDTPALSIFELRAKCRRLKAQKDIQLVVLDYLQLMSASGDSRNFNREQEISGISRAIKSLAKELDIPIIALSQLSRAVETRSSSKRPILSDLRESGAIEQDADIVMFIYRPEYYKIAGNEAGELPQGYSELIIAKHRNGALKDITVRFIDKFAKFTDLESQDYDLSGIIATDEEPRVTKTFPSKMNEQEN